MKPSEGKLARGLAVVFAALLLSTEILAQPGSLQVLPKRLPDAALNAETVGRLPAGERLSLAIGLPLRNKPDLQTLLHELYDPASTNFHHYLTTEQFTERFGPTEKDYRGLKTFAKANHLEITTEYRNRVLLGVSGTVADIERVFHTTLRTYQHPTEARTFYAPDVAPSLHLAVPVASVGGLNNYALARPHLQTVSLASQIANPNSGSGPGGTYRGSDFRAAYVPDSTRTGAGQSVGLLEFDGYTAGDVTYYETQAGLPNVPLSNVLLDGANGLPSGSGGEVEVSLDIEVAIAIAPNLNQMIVYEAPNPSPFEVILNRMVSDNTAKQLSCSWFIPGGGADPTADGIFQEMAAQGQSFFNASGDDDAYNGLINFPGDNPYITQVGGTTLTTSGAGSPRTAETVWNRGGGIGSGGGISTQYSIPAYQTNINMSANQGSTTMRNTPDVAAVADNVYVRVDGQDYSVGGTSCAAPLWAGFGALINEQAAASGHPTVGFINPAVDAIGTGPTYTQCFFDITTGNNTSPSSPTKFYAVSGYDLCTGWGTPAGQNLINALANPEPLLISPVTGFSSMGGAHGPFTVVSQELSLTNSGTNSLSWALGNPVPWLDATPTAGILGPGQAPSIVTVSLNAVASNLIVGTYSGTLWFTNLNDTNTLQRDYSLTVLAPPSITMQPVDQSVLDGAPAEFFVAATGGMPLFYQWQLDGTNLMDGGDFTGTATTNLTVSDVSVGDTGMYTVVVTNLAGSATSSNAVLAITPSVPVITVQPASQTVVAGKTAVFSVGAIGSKPFYYQWSYGGPGGTNIDGATNATLSLADVQLAESGIYSVVVSNSLGSTTSSNAVLNVVLVPAIANFSPLSGASGTNVSITGFNFSDLPGSNIVYFGAVQALVTSQSTNNLTVVVPTNATFAPISVTVNGLTCYSDQPFMPTFPGIGVLTNNSFAPAFNLNTGGGPLRVAIADLDGDGKSDLVVGDITAGVISIFRNISSNGVLSAASFAAPVNLVVGPAGASTDPYTIAVADLDGDGRLDIVALNADSNIVSIFRNISSPGVLMSNSFAARIDLPGGNVMRGVAVQDLDGDGRPEIVVANAGDNNVSIYKNLSGVGNIAFAPRVNIACGKYPVTIAIGDLDGDGFPDIAVAAYNSAAVSVLRNVGFTGTITTNSFARAVSFSGPVSAQGLALGDIDGDGKLDIVMGGAEGSSSLTVYRNTSTPGIINNNSFASAVVFALAGWCNSIALADMDGSGKLDIAVVNESGNTFSVFKNLSTPGSFTTSSLAARLDFPAGSDPWGISMGDLNGDGRPDVVFASYYDGTLSIYQNVVPFVGPPVITSQPANETVEVGDTASFSVTASGSPTLTYQWFNGSGSITGATNSMLTLSNVQLSAAGTYYVTVSNPYGSTNSADAKLTVTNPPPCTPPPSGIVAWWPAEGNANDIIGGNNGMLVGGLGFTNGEVGQAFNFTNPSAYVSIPESSSLNVGASNGFTVEAWINPSDVSNQHPLVEWTTPAGNAAVHLWISVTYGGGGGPGCLYANVIDTNGTAHVFSSPPGVVTTGVFQHVALTYNKTNGVGTLYYNGTSVGSSSLGTFTPGTANPLLLGHRINSVDTFAGALDEVSIYNRALAQSEIAAIYNAGSGGKCFTPVLPTITAQPTNETVEVGGTAGFSVTASGSPRLTYQWFNGSGSIGGATNSTLTLSNVQLSAAGAYYVTVSNPYGSTNSADATLTLTNPPSCTPPPSGIVAWWPAEGNANDIIGGNNGTLIGGLGFTNGEVGQAFNFTNPSAYVSIPESSTLNVGASNGFTVEAWINPSDVSNQHPLMEWTTQAGKPAVHFWISVTYPGGGGPGCLYANVIDTNNTAHVFSSPAGVVTRGVFQHVALTYNKTNGVATLYYNGASVGSSSFGTFTPGTANPLLLGHRANSAVTFAGALDEVGIYNRALAQNEIAAIYNAGSAGKCFTPILPTITAQPTNETVDVVSTASFSVTASGSPTLTYQWFNGGGSITGATNSTLTLSNVLLSADGSYYVAVSNPYGSTNSVDATLTVTNPPPMLAVSYSGNLALSWPVWAAGFNLEATADLTPPIAWTNVSIPLVTNGANVQVTVPTAGQQTFFRLYLP